MNLQHSLGIGYIDFVFYVVTILFILCTTIYCFKRLMYYKRITKKTDKNIDLYVPYGFSATKVGLKAMNEKRCGYIKNYIVFQAVNKVSGLSGVIYAVLGMLMSMIDGVSSWMLYTTNLISIISVIIALYISPTKRASEYLDAWRVTDAFLAKISTDYQVAFKAGTESLEFKSINDEYNAVWKKTEVILASDHE